MKTLEQLTDHRQKRVAAVACKLMIKDTVRLSKAGEIEAAFKIREILGKDKVIIKRVDYSSDHTVKIL